MSVILCRSHVLPHMSNILRKFPSHDIAKTCLICSYEVGLSGNSDIAVANVVGSSIFNVAAGTSLLVIPLLVGRVYYFWQAMLRILFS